MDTTIITRRHIAALVRNIGLDTLLDDLIVRLHDACTAHDPGHIEVRTRDGFHYSDPHPGLLEWMPAMEAGRCVTIKVVGYHPENPSRALPTIISTISVYDTSTGHLLAVADGTFLTALRTAAASAVASRILARPDSRVLGLIGCGAQAVAHAHALSRLFPLEKILIADPDGDALASFPDRIASRVPAGLAVLPVALDLLVQDCDILCTATSIDVGAGPLFDQLETRPWVHINAVGSDFPGKTELPTELLQAALVVPDYREQCIREGECQQLAADEIGPDLATLVRDAQEYESSRNTRTVFDSTGWALEDHVAMQMLLEYADKLGLGQRTALESLAGDARDPYHFAEIAIAAQPAKQASKKG